MTTTTHFDYVLVGGGLANGLIALELLRTRPNVRIALVERSPALGGNHTWSFHEQDIDPAMAATVQPLVGARWAAHDVAFPSRQRRLPTGYASIFSYDLNRALRRALSEHSGCALFLSESAQRLEAHRVELEGGKVLEAAAVLDGRGPDPGIPHSGGYQKFLGLEVSLTSPSPRQVPFLMDATVPQVDGFRFVYVLPFEPQRVLIEDTYYSTSPILDRETLRQRILSYANQNGYDIGEVLREEVGVLPIPTRRSRVSQPGGAIGVGVRGNWFHPTTGYSLPVAARLARFIACHTPGELFGPGFRKLQRDHERQARFARWLNRLLFGAFAPGDRFHVLERFYGLPEETIARFYALHTTARDRSRILCGRPPRGFSVTQLLVGDATA